MNLKKIPKKLLLKGGKIFDPTLDKLKKADILISPFNYGRWGE